MDDETMMPPWAEAPDTAVAAVAAMERAEVDANDAGTDLVGAIDRDRWSIAGPNEAEWAMAHVAAATDHLAAIRAQYHLWLSKLNDWRAAIEREPRRTVEFFTWHLEQWGTQERTDKQKTIRLASGDIATRRPSEPKVIVVDDEAVIRFAEQTTVLVPSTGSDDDGPEMMTLAETGVVKIAKSVLVSELRSWCEVHEHRGVLQTDIGPAENADDGSPVEYVSYSVTMIDSGEVVPGVAVEPPETTATVKPRPVHLARTPEV